MPDNTNDRGGRDRNRVSGEQEWEINYVMAKTGASREGVERAIKEVGNSREKVEEFLQRKK